MVERSSANMSAIWHLRNEVTGLLFGVPPHGKKRRRIALPRLAGYGTCSQWKLALVQGRAPDYYFNPAGLATARLTIFPFLTVAMIRGYKVTLRLPNFSCIWPVPPNADGHCAPAVSASLTFV